jgi:predicted transposase/invertase (TIGR01784 family)
VIVIGHQINLTEQEHQKYIHIMTTSTPQIHDHFFKQIFSRPENVRDFIETYLSAEIVSHLELETLEVVNSSYVDVELSEYFSDVVIKTRLKSGDPAEVYFLFEHKSGPERYVRVQVLQYMASSWYYQVRSGLNKGSLPLIIPVVIYHGHQTWKYSCSFEDLFCSPCPEFSIYIPKFEHILHDISHLDEKEIKGTVVLQVAQLLFKYIQVPELRERLPEILELLGELSEKDRITEYLQVILEYVFQATDHVDVQDVRKALQKIPQGESVMPTIAEKLREEGMQQGMQQGELQGKRIALLQLMDRKFSLSSHEEALISSVEDQKLLDQALDAVLFAQDKTEVLGLFC